MFALDRALGPSGRRPIESRERSPRSRKLHNGERLGLETLVRKLAQRSPIDAAAPRGNFASLVRGLDHVVLTKLSLASVSASDYSDLVLPPESSRCLALQAIPIPLQLQ
ncbi:hypothetical protein [Ferrimicrobium acidiphilum]|uniref:hypothetical protein n=1 Tax=Ferrimicrobium acidiphilum TaxID=121039 RepID=UPI0023F1372B|nr:hypothetical protein [Ferrimicrobium acidiphilum]